MEDFLLVESIYSADLSESMGNPTIAEVCLLEWLFSRIELQQKKTTVSITCAGSQVDYALSNLPFIASKKYDKDKKAAVAFHGQFGSSFLKRFE